MLTILENIFLCIIMGGLCLMAAIGFLFLLAISVWMIIKYFKDDITWCGNLGCADMKCHRNPKHIRVIDIPHSFALFDKCPKWDCVGAAWLIKQMEGEAYEP